MPPIPTTRPQTPSLTIVEAMQASLKLHLSQAEMYQGQSEHFLRWGYSKLAATWAEYAQEERDHQKMLLGRLEFYDVSPELEHLPTPWPRHDFEGILSANYDADVEAAAVERGGYVLAVSVGAAIEAKMFTKLLKGSEDSMANIEAIQKVLEQIGSDNYLANQV